jgi:hypothetical protein
MRFLSCGVFAATLVAVAAASAQENKTPQAVVAPTVVAAAGPSAQVGRVSLVWGQVAFRGPSETLWSDAGINDPIASGVALRTDPQARAEMRIDADTIDLADDTDIEIAELTDRTVEIAVPRGRIVLDIRRVGVGESIQIDIPRGGARLLQPGRYDVDAGSGDRPPRIAAFTGAARFAGGGADLPIKAGNALVLTGPAAATAATEPAAADEFAEWCRARAVGETRLAAPYYVSPSMTGFDELDDAGKWQADGKYGEAWVPNSLPADWAPYRDGHWRWVTPWGWTWIDDQPWGFAPSHYGRWAFAYGHWIWFPGRFTAHPGYAPALVAFLGTPGVGLSFAEGSGPAVAWFPLAPGEVYWPSYTNDVDYIRRLNAANVADVDAIRVRANGEPPPEIVNGDFANRQFASVVPRPVFVAGQAVAPALVTLPQERLKDAPAIMGSPQIPPPAPASPTRVAVAQPVHKHPPAAHVAAVASKRVAWASIVRAAAIRARNYQKSLLIRAAHLRAPSFAGSSGPRYSIVLRVARAAHPPLRAEARKKEIKR